MRCFIALDIPKELKDTLFELQTKLKNKNAKIKWIAKKNLHVTMRFLGDCKENKIEVVQEKLKHINFKQIRVKLDELSIFPHEQAPRILWIGLKPEEPILRLAQRIDEETLEINARKQRFTSHLTLGRIKTLKSKQVYLNALKEVKLEKRVFILTSFTLSLIHI